MPFSILRTSSHRPRRISARSCGSGRLSCSTASHRPRWSLRRTMRRVRWVSKSACLACKPKRSRKSSCSSCSRAENGRMPLFIPVACMFSPRIESVEAHPGTYALDIRGMDSCSAMTEQLANKLRQRVMTAGFLANVAVAENFHAAVCLARGQNRRLGCAVRLRRRTRLRDLPLRRSNLAPEHEATFAAWGIRTCAAAGRTRRDRSDCPARTSGKEAALSRRAVHGRT